CSLFCAQLHRHVAEKLCAESAYNHSVHTPLARGKNRSRKITTPLCGFERHFVAKSGFIQLTRWRFGLSNCYRSGIPPRAWHGESEAVRTKKMLGKNSVR